SCGSMAHPQAIFAERSVPGSSESCFRAPRPVWRTSPSSRKALSPIASQRRRAVVTAAIATLLLLVTWPLAVPAVRDMVTLDAAPGARLTHSTAYLALSPVYDVMDAFTLLSVGQLVALLISLALLHVGW